MTIDALVRDLEKSGVKLIVDGGDLIVDAPDNVLSNDVVSRIRDAKPALLAYLLQRAQGQEIRGMPLSRRPNDGRKSFPLSPAQARLWYLDQFEGSSAAYNLPFAYAVESGIDVQKLEDATSFVIRNQLALRTTFDEVDGEPRQFISDDLPFTLRRFEVREPLGSPLVDSAIIDFCVEPFDLKNGPLIRGALIATSDNKFVLVYVVHHIAFDGTSVELFENELRRAFEGAGHRDPKGIDTVDFLDYVLWQEAHLTDEVIANRLKYWTQTLDGATSPIDLPTDFPRPPEPTYVGGRVRLKVDDDLLDSVRRCARNERASPFMIIMAAYACVLLRYSRSDTVVIGYPVANREHEHARDLIGLFVNTVPLRVTADPATTFRKLLEDVKSSVLSGLDHADLPFERLVEEINPVRDISRSPLFQVFASSVERDADTLSIGGVNFSRYPVPLPVSRVDLSLFSTSFADHIDLVVEYASDLFEKASAQRLVELLKQVLVRATSNTSVTIRQLTHPPDDERDLQLRLWNRTDIDFGRDFRVEDLITAHLESPGKCAVFSREEKITYGELERSANRLANRLINSGIQPGDIVGIHMERTIGMIVALLAVFRAGAGYLPLDPSFPSDRLEYMLRDAGARGLVTHSAVRNPLKLAGGINICFDDWHTDGDDQVHARPAASTTPDDIAYILYTSGSTGRPKGVVVPHRCVTNFLQSMLREPGLTSGDVMLAVTTISFDISVLEIFLPLIAGASLFLANSEDGQDGRRLAELIELSRATVLQATPSTWHMLLESGWEGQPRLKCLSGGEPLTNELAAGLHARCGELWNLYGPTETTVWSTCGQITDPKSPVTIGRPIANTQVYILGPNLEPQPIGVPGELYIGGLGVGLGYKNLPELTNSCFVDDPFSDDPGARLYRTGDLARWRNDGQLQHLGRTGSQVKIRGFRIELGEIESVLGQHGSISHAACRVWSPSQGDQRLVAYCVVRPGQTLVPTDLRKHLRRLVPDYMIPQHFESIDEIPLTANGKIDRKSLPSPQYASIRPSTSPPRSAQEILVARIWAEILGIDAVSRHDNFFDIGGHSLLAVRAAAAMEKASGHRPELREFVLDDLSLIAGRIPSVPSQQPTQGKSRSLLSRLFGR